MCHRVDGGIFIPLSNVASSANHPDKKARRSKRGVYALRHARVWAVYRESEYLLA